MLSSRRNFLTGAAASVFAIPAIAKAVSVLDAQAIQLLPLRGMTVTLPLAGSVLEGYTIKVVGPGTVTVEAGDRFCWPDSPEANVSHIDYSHQMRCDGKNWHIT